MRIAHRVFEYFGCETCEFLQAGSAGIVFFKLVSRGGASRDLQGDVFGSYQVFFDGMVLVFSARVRFCSSLS